MRVGEGEGVGRMRWLGDGLWGNMCCGECWVLCKTDELQTYTPETN